jgi:general secretion pathway protein F
MEGADSMTVLRQLQNEGLVPIRADLITARAPHTRGWFRSEAVTQQDIELVAGELAMLLNAGVALDRALGMAARLSNKARLGDALKTLEQAMRQGRSFPDALADQPDMFPTLLVNLSRAGEAGGRLSEALARAASYLEAARNTRESLISALLYPVVLCFLAMSSVILMVTFVVPRFAVMFDDVGVPLPLATRVLASIGEAMTQYGLYGVVGLGLVAWLARRQLRRESVRLWVDARLLDLPVIGDLIAKIEAARFARIMSTLLASGTAVPNALTIAQASASNLAVGRKVGVVAQAVRAGHGLAAQLEREAVFPALMGHMLGIGEESDRLGEVLDKVAEMFEKDVERGMKRAIILIEPILIVGVGVIVAAVVFGILSAVLSVNELA